MSPPLLAVAGLAKSFRRGGRTIEALADVGFTLQAGETLAVVGASGSGKSTLARLILRLVAPDAGTIQLDGHDWLALRGAALRRARSRVQMVFQDPQAAFNPRATVARVIEDPLRIHAVVPHDALPRRVTELLERVGLSSALAHQPVQALSGGQRQRVAIARAFASRPALVVLDEAVSALDVSVRGQILALLLDLQSQDGIAYLFISHDLGVVRAFAPDIVVLDTGRVVEHGKTREVLTQPQSTAARALVEAVPKLHRDTSQNGDGNDR